MLERSLNVSFMTTTTLGFSEANCAWRASVAAGSQLAS